jgi:hypothetical protein
MKDNTYRRKKKKEKGAKVKYSHYLPKKRQMLLYHDENIPLGGL